MPSFTVTRVLWSWIWVYVTGSLLVHSSHACGFEDRGDDCCEPSRVIVPSSIGRNSFVRLPGTEGEDDLPSKWVSVPYCNRGMEWVRLPDLIQLAIEHVLPDISLPFHFRFAFSLLPSVRDMLYHPRRVFTDFSVQDLLLTEPSKCPCQYERYAEFRDDRTLSEFVPPGVSPVSHVRTIMAEIVKNKCLRSAVKCGLNHVPIEPTFFEPISDVLRELWWTVLEHLEPVIPYDVSSTDLYGYGLELLLRAGSQRFEHGFVGNLGGFRNVGPSTWGLPEVQLELEELSSRFYFSGVDKAAQTPMFKCIDHERLQAYHRLAGPDFRPCVTSEGELMRIEDVLSNVCDEVQHLLPEFPTEYDRLPYIFSMYKEHKGKHRWLTNAHNCVFSSVATLVQVTTEAALSVVEQCVGIEARTFSVFTGSTDTTPIYPPVNSMYDVLLNLPREAHSVFAADVTRCYEAIPVDALSEHNLQTTVRWLLRKAFARQKEVFRHDVWLWVNWHIGKDKPCNTRWARTRPQGKYWVGFSMERLFQISVWLMTHAFVVLGDRVWLQILGIAMGFGCSPVWCKVYLLFYEYHFVVRVRRLGFSHILDWFAWWFRYIDDVLLVNCPMWAWFFEKGTVCDERSPYWIYPLGVVDISPEVVQWGVDKGTGMRVGFQVHYLNFTLTVASGGGLHVCRYVKRKSLPFPVVSFVRFDSNRPVRMFYGVLLSQVMPYIYVNSDVTGFVKDISELVHVLASTGAPMVPLIQRVVANLRPEMFPGVQFSLDSAGSKLMAMISQRKRRRS